MTPVSKTSGVDRGRVGGCQCRVQEIGVLARNVSKNLALLAPTPKKLEAPRLMLPVFQIDHIAIQTRDRQGLAARL